MVNVSPTLSILVWHSVRMINFEFRLIAMAVFFAYSKATSRTAFLDVGASTTMSTFLSLSSLIRTSDESPPQGVNVDGLQEGLRCLEILHILFDR
jgi:hypothetical protein